MSEQDSSTASRPRVLSVGHDPDLLRTRELVLESAGFEVLTVAGHASLKDALGRLEKAKEFHGFVLGQSLPLEERVELASRLRKTAPGAGIVFLHYPGETFDARNCDAVVITPSDPEKLLTAVRRAIQRAAQRRRSES